MTRIRSSAYHIQTSPVSSNTIHISNRLTPQNGIDNNPAVWLHGANGTYTSTPFSGFTELALRGVPLTGGNNGGVLTFGNDTAINAIDGEVTEALEYYGLDTVMDKVVIVGGSMGSVNALNYALAHPERVAVICIYLIIVDLDDIVTNNRGGFAADILSAHGGSVPSSKNPIENTAAFEATGIPTRFYCSDDDSIGLASLAASFADSCSNVEFVSYGAQGHTTSGLPFDEAIDWILENLD